LSVESDEFDTAVQLVEKGVGAVWMMGGLPLARAVKINELQSHAKVPMLVMGADSLGKQLYAARSDKWMYGSGTDVPSPMAYSAIGDLSAIREAGRIVALEARAMGVSFMDDDGGINLLTNLANVLQNRSFGDDPEKAGRLAAAFIQGVHDAGLLAYVGFFPGAGDIAGDPHVELPVTLQDRKQFYEFDFVPFRQAIDAGVDIVMSSHFAVPGLTGSDTLPATLSPEVTRILREELGFKGILITDDLSMGGISNTYGGREASIKAIQAGNDLLLSAPYSAGDYIAEAVANGEIPEEQLVASVRRILEAKARLGLHKNRYVSVDNLNRIVGNRDHQHAADDAADRSIVLLRDQNKLVPIAAESSRRVLSVTFERDDNEEAGDEFNAVLRQHVNSVDTERVSPTTDPSVYANLRQRAMNSDQIVLSVYIRPQLGVSQYVEMSDDFVQFVQQLQADGSDVVLISFGKLTVLDMLPNLDTFMLAWSEQSVMQRAAARALVGVIPITARLPVTLPPHHKRGDGLDRPASFTANR